MVSDFCCPTILAMKNSYATVLSENPSIKSSKMFAQFVFWPKKLEKLDIFSLFLDNGNNQYIEKLQLTLDLFQNIFFIKQNYSIVNNF